MDTVLFLILIATAALLFFRLGSVKQSGEIRSADISHAFRRRKKR